MKIETEKYKIVSDPCCMWIVEKRTNSKGKTTEKRVSGYHVRFKDLLVSFCERNTLRSDAKTVKEMLEVFAKQEEEVKKLLQAITDEKNIK